MKVALNNEVDGKKKCFQCGKDEGIGENCKACAYLRVEKEWFKRTTIREEEQDEDL
jgi:hypothetical protein